MKDLKNKSKRKWIVGGVLLFGSIALLTTGFATWVIGINATKRDNGGTSVAIEATVSDNYVLNVDFSADNSITVSENSDDGNLATKGEVSWKVISPNEKLDFSVTGNMSVKIGNNSAYYGSTDLRLKFYFNYENNPSYTDENDKTSGNKISGYTATSWREAGDYEYLGLRGEMAISSKGENGAVAESGWSRSEDASNETYTYNGNPIELFTWGSYFGNMAPSEFYTRTTDPDFSLTDTDVVKIQEEMNAMYSALNGGNIHVVIEVEGSTTK